MGDDTGPSVWLHLSLGSSEVKFLQGLGSVHSQKHVLHWIARKESALSMAKCALQGVFQSCCHVPDLYKNASCRADGQCGVDALLCRPRACSQHGWCITPPQVSAAAALTPGVVGR